MAGHRPEKEVYYIRDNGYEVECDRNYVVNNWHYRYMGYCTVNGETRYYYQYIFNQE